MHITILTYGSRGDVQPFLALALGLQEAGHTVKLAAPHRFTEFVEEYGVSIVPLAGDPEIISQRLNDAGANPIRMIRAMSDYLFEIAEQVARKAFTACDDANLIVHSFLFTTGGHSLACKLGIPDVSVHAFPTFAPTRELPPVAVPNLSPGLLGYFFHWLFTQVFWHGGNLGFRRLQKADPDFFNVDLYWPFTPDASRIMTPLLLACSPTVIPRPDDWSSPHIHIPGYYFLESPDAYQPPAELNNFLMAGEPPVCVTFGSMINRDAERIYQSVYEALAKTKNRAIILSGWGDMQNLNLPENILVMESVSHDWLLPRCKVVIHHGGAGTTAAGLRSGIPNIVVSFAADQPFWGARVHSIGAGPQSIPVKNLTAEKLVDALAEADKDSLRSNAQAIGRKIRMENGVEASVKIIEAHVEKWLESSQSESFKV